MRDREREEEERERERGWREKKVRDKETQREYEISRDALETMYKSFIFPHFNCADITWNNCTETQSNMLENLHSETIRTIIGGSAKPAMTNLMRNPAITNLMRNPAMTNCMKNPAMTNWMKNPAMTNL